MLRFDTKCFVCVQSMGMLRKFGGWNKNESGIAWQFTQNQQRRKITEGTQFCMYRQNRRDDISYWNKGIIIIRVTRTWTHVQTHTSLPSRGTLSAAGSPMQTLPVGPRNNGYCRTLRHSDMPWPHLRVSADNKSSTFKWTQRWQINKVMAPKA